MQEKTAGGTPAAPIKLDVSVRVIEPVKNLMGFASVKFNDCFVVENLKIVQGSKGLFLGMFDVNKAIMRCLVKNLAMFGLGLYVYAGEDLPEDAAPQPEAEPQKQPKSKSTSQKPEQPPVPCICARCNQPIKRVKLKDGSIMQAAEFAATHEGMCADCYKATRLNVA